MPKAKKILGQITKPEYSDFEQVQLLKTAYNADDSNSPGRNQLRYDIIEISRRCYHQYDAGLSWALTDLRQSEDEGDFSILASKKNASFSAVLKAAKCIWADLML